MNRNNKKNPLTIGHFGLLNNLDQFVCKVLDIKQTVGNIGRLVDLDQRLVKDGNHFLEDFARDALEDQAHQSLLLPNPQMRHKQILQLLNEITLVVL